VVCDNTRDLAPAEHRQDYKVKHSQYSQAKLAPARDALMLVHTLDPRAGRVTFANCYAEWATRQL
jgi:hypothetical protein